uniref:Uncharacterized protein n=1 Tax=Heterorhabditis bacteriophora TaxID=37862 RepID=A0A1I7WN39_HETBA
MSASNVVAESDSGTLVKERNRYDSLCTDEFEIVTDEILENERQVCEDSTSQWSMPHSINIEPIIPFALNSLTPLLTIPSENKITIKRSASSANSIGEQVSTRSDEETPILKDKVSLSPEATIETVLRSQNETRKILEATLVSIETLSNGKSEAFYLFLT